MRRCMGLLTLALACCLTLGAAGDDAAVIEAVDKIAAYDYGQSREPLTVVSDMIREAYGDEETLEDIAEALAALLETDATYAAKQFACKQLSLLGTGDQVPTLAGLLPDEELSDMARYALERIDDSSADKVLIKALDLPSGPVKIGIINSLGERQTASAVKTLRKLMSDEDRAVASAAVAALGKIATPSAAKALSARALACPCAADAYMLCADAYLAKGKTKRAVQIYEEMYTPDRPARVQVAALRGIVMAKGEDAVNVVAEALGSSDASMQAIAAGFIREMAGENVTEAFAEAVPAQKPAVQALMLSALGDRGDAAALSAASTATKSPDEAVRTAALAAVGKLGDASSVLLLGEAAADARGAEQDAARKSLDTLRDDGVDDAMIALVVRGDAPVRAELIRSLSARGVVKAVPELLKAAEASEPVVREAALRALAELGGEKELSAAVDFLLAALSDNERTEAEKTVVALARKVSDPRDRITPVLAAAAKTKNERAVCALMRALGSIGDDKGLSVPRAHVGSESEVLNDTAVRVLADWPTATPMQDLLALAAQADGETHRIIALRGALRMLGMASSRPGAETLALYKEAMKLATRTDEKKMIVSGLTDVSDPAVIEVLEAYAKDPQLKAEAELALSKVRSRSYVATASRNGGAAKNALDGNPATRWDTGAVMQGGEWYQLDMAWENTSVTRLVLDTKGSANDYPRAYEVYVSNNPNELGAPVATGKGDNPVLEIKPKRNAGRYLRIVQTGKADGNYWSIHELTVETKQ